jgi:hypothetical protein
MPPKELIKEIILNGTPEQKKILFSFNKDTPDEKVVKKFKLFARSQYPRYFHNPSAPFHDGMVLRTIKSYRGKNVVEVGFRGCSKTTTKKLIRAFILLNDEDHSRKFLKVLCRDLSNSKQIVTDIFNLCIEVRHIYGDVFEKQGEKKVEETMLGFTMACGVKVTASTVGQKQRGHIQDAYRPDWVWFEDIEDVESVSSQVITEGVIQRCDEAITGLSRDGSWELTGNYISDTGSVQWFLEKKNIIKEIIPIMTDGIIKDGKVLSGTPTWSIYTLQDIQALHDDALDFYGDYMCDPNHSENKFFNIERVEEDMRKAVPPMRTSGLVKYWGRYLEHHRYGLGSDHSEGVGKDANTAVLWDFKTGYLMASYANNEIAPDLSTYEFARLGEEFGNCTWGAEINNKCGGIVLATQLQIGYPRLYEQKTLVHGEEVPSGKFGWQTNSKTKNTMFFEFKRDYNDGLIHILDMELLKEMKAYTNNDLTEKTTGLITRHFDLLTAAVIGWQMRAEDPERRGIVVSYNL